MAEYEAWKKQRQDKNEFVKLPSMPKYHPLLDSDLSEATKKIWKERTDMNIKNKQKRKRAYKTKKIKHYCDKCRVYWSKYHSCFMTKNEQRQDTKIVSQVTAAVCT